MAKAKKKTNSVAITSVEGYGVMLVDRQGVSRPLFNSDGTLLIRATKTEAVFVLEHQWNVGVACQGSDVVPVEVRLLPSKRTTKGGK